MPLTETQPDSPAIRSDVEAAKHLGEVCHQLKHEMGKVIVGQDKVLDELLIAIFARGHCIMQGVPGLAKTLLVSTLAKTLSTFCRVFLGSLPSYWFSILTAIYA